MRRRCSSAAAVAASSTRLTRCPVSAEVKTMLAHSTGRSSARMLASNSDSVRSSLSGTLSHLFTTTTHALPSAATYSESLKSCWVTPSDASMTSTATSARRTAWNARSTDSGSAPSFPDAIEALFRTPAVSMSLKQRPSGIWISVSIASRVVPAIELTMDRSFPTNEFSNELFPTFGRPMMAILTGTLASSMSPYPSGGGKPWAAASSSSPVPLPLIADTAIGSIPSSQNTAACSSAFPTFSHLFTASVTDFPGCDCRSHTNTSSSEDVGPVCPSTTIITESDSTTAAAACRSIAVGRNFSEMERIAASRCVASGNSSALLISPPVSTSIKSRPPQFARVYSRSRVTPG
mmetsp:Transcript_13464/g.39082  ORF Transcript_13464/g.39082 Transcript_13464/m.39082 type:complete len:349 (-) Transcript_13464:382-1428(-)